MVHCVWLARSFFWAINVFILFILWSVQGNYGTFLLKLMFVGYLDRTIELNAMLLCICFNLNSAIAFACMFFKHRSKTFGLVCLKVLLGNLHNNIVLASVLSSHCGIAGWIYMKRHHLLSTAKLKSS